MNRIAWIVTVLFAVGCQSAPQFATHRVKDNSICIRCGTDTKTVPTTDGAIAIRDLESKLPFEAGKLQFLNVKRGNLSIFVPWNKALISTTDVGDITVFSSDAVTIVTNDETSLSLDAMWIESKHFFKSDMKATRRRYASRVNPDTAMYPVQYRYVDAAGRVIHQSERGQIDKESGEFLSPQLSVAMGFVTSAMINPTLTLERSIDGLNEIYILPFEEVLPVERDRKTYKPVAYCKGAFLFDGDVLTLTSLDAVPLLQASKVVNETIVQPERAKRKAMRLLEKHRDKQRQLEAAEPWWGRLGF